jgi:hypothetical protein
MYLKAIAALLALLLVAPPAADPRHLGFQDVAEAAGVRFRHVAGKTGEKYLPESMGSGVAMLDYDNDGFLDLFFVNGAELADPMPSGGKPDKSDPRCWNRLFHNNRNGTFTDVTERAGLRGDTYGTGVAAGDYDNDGLSDLYVTGLGHNTLYRNMGDGTFRDVTVSMGVGGGGWSVAPGFVDYDRDGYLDLIVTRYVEWSFAQNPYCGERRPGYRAYCHPDRFEPATHLVFHNEGGMTFTEVSKKCGIGGAPGKGLGIAVDDFDDDGWPDVAVANDSFPQQLFRNNRDGTFTEIATDAGAAYDEDGRTFGGMGIDSADFDNDGRPDLFINALALQRYALFRNRTGRAFDYVSGPTGVGGMTANHSGWGAKWIDYDNDGWRDLLVAQGHVMDNIELTQPSARYREPLLLARNTKGRFEDVSQQSGPAFQLPLAARGAAFGDLDNDGSVDVAINCNDGPALLVRNRGGTGNHWLLVRAVGTRSNRSGIGARMRLVAESGAERRGYSSTSGSYASANDPRVHFGLGRDTKVRLLEVQWPSGAVQRLENVAADQVLTVREPQ